MHTAAEIVDAIDIATEPGRMSKSEALSFIERIITDLESRCEALKEEMRDEPE